SVIVPKLIKQALVVIGALVFLALCFRWLVAVLPHGLHCVDLLAWYCYAVLARHLPASFVAGYRLEIFGNVRSRVGVAFGRSRHILRLDEFAAVITVLASRIIFVVVDLTNNAFPRFLAERFTVCVKYDCVEIVRRHYVVICYYVSNAQIIVLLSV